MVPGQGQCLEFIMTPDTRPMRLREKPGEKIWSLLSPNMFHQVVLTREKASSDYCTGLIQQKKSSL